MTEFVTVEPAHERRAEFALWCLSQTPQIMTSSASGFDVPMDLYPSIPEKLLNGAYVDGYHYDRPSPQPEAARPVAAPSETVAAARPATRKRGTRARKASE